MKHIDEEQLMLYYYGEATEPKPIAAHLGTCDACRAEYEALCASLAMLESWKAPDPCQDYEVKLWKKLQDGMPPTGKRSLRRWILGFSPWPQLLGACTLLALAFLAGVLWKGEPPRDRPAVESVQHRLLFASLEEHLERGEIFLTEYANAGRGGEPDVNFQKDWARQLSNSNRLLRQAVRQQGDHEIGGLLDSLEIVLLESLHHADAREDEDLLQQCRELIFKIRIISTRLQRNAAPPSKATAVSI